MKSKLLFLMVFCLFLSFGLTAQVLEYSSPDLQGMSTERLERIDRVIQEYIDQEKIPGAGALIARNGKIVYHKSFGTYDQEGQSPLPNDAIFRIASQTKAITSLAVMMLLEEGKFLLDDRISKYIPEFANPSVLKTFNEKDSTYTAEPASKEITIRHLLTHTSGLDYAAIGSPEFRAIYAKAYVHPGIGLDNDELGSMMKRLGPLPLKFNPGERFQYSLSTDVLGYLVEVVSGMSLDRFFRERIFIPLGMNDTYFYLPKEKHQRLVPLYAHNSGKLVPARAALVGGNPDYPKLEGSFYSGGAGLSSTLEDYAKFLQMIVNGGRYNGVRLLSRKTIELMLTNQISEEVSETRQVSLGFGIETEKNDHLSPMSIGSFLWGGAFSTSYWADPKEKLVGLMYLQISPNMYGDIHEKFKVLTYQAFND